MSIISVESYSCGKTKALQNESLSWKERLDAALSWGREVKKEDGDLLLFRYERDKMSKIIGSIASVGNISIVRARIHLDTISTAGYYGHILAKQ